MEIAVRRDAFRSGFEVILFAPGCAKKEGSDEGDGAGGGGSLRKSGRALSLRPETRHVTRAEFTLAKGHF